MSYDLRLKLTRGPFRVGLPVNILKALRLFIIMRRISIILVLYIAMKISIVLVSYDGNIQVLRRSRPQTQAKRQGEEVSVDHGF